jgi:hypothetical protein
LRRFVEGEFAFIDEDHHGGGGEVLVIEATQKRASGVMSRPCSALAWPTAS